MESLNINVGAFLFRPFAGKIIIYRKSLARMPSDTNKIRKLAKCQEMASST